MRSQESKRRPRGATPRTLRSFQRTGVLAERELLKGYYQEFYEHGFGYAYLISGLTRVVQAAGRRLRSSSASR